MIKDTNKRFFVTISLTEYDELKEIAKKENRSVSRQSLQFIQEGIKKHKEKRSN